MEGFASFSTQAGVSVSARHFFGVNTSIKDSVYLIGEDITLLYVAGHNIVLYRLDEKEQSFMAGSNDTEAITHVALAKSKKFISVCERSTAGNKGKFSIFDLNTLKKLKEMPQ